MNPTYVYASSQIITKNPILREDKETRYQYYVSLQKLLRAGGWISRQYTKESLRYYKTIIKIDDTPERKTPHLPKKYALLLVFDVAAILQYSKKQIRSKRMKEISVKIASNFKLNQEERWILSWEILASSGDSKSWEKIFHEDSLKEFREYLDDVKKNIMFISRKPCTLLVTATMSAGKSTLINALTGKYISRMQNMACTSKIHVISSKPFEDGATLEYDHEICLDATVSDLIDNDLENRNPKVWVGTFFQGRLGGKRLSLLDSPGVNSNENKDHAEISSAAISSQKYDLVLYILNATQLGTTDNDRHLEFIAQTIGEKELIFVMNKIDSVITEEEDLFGILERQKEYLKSKGFKNPKIYPVSARAAYLAKKSKTEQLKRMEQRELENLMDKFEMVGLPIYYEKELGCTTIPTPGNEVDALLRNCGLSYLEDKIDYICQEIEKNRKRLELPGKTKSEEKLAQVCVKYNSYKHKTTLEVNGKEVAADNGLYKGTQGKRLQEWIGEFPQNLRDELDTMDFSLEFYGIPLDWGDFCKSLEIAERSGLVRVNAINYEESMNDRIQVVFRAVFQN